MVYLLNTDDGLQIKFGHFVVKRKNGSVVEYWLNQIEIDELDYGESIFRSWKCTTEDECNGCKPKRSGFLGLGGVTECPCTNTTQEDPKYCKLETSAGNFPWAPVLGLIGVLISVLT